MAVIFPGMLREYGMVILQSKNIEKLILANHGARISLSAKCPMNKRVLNDCNSSSVMKPNQVTPIIFCL